MTEPHPTNPHYDEFAAAYGDASARGPIDYRLIEVIDPQMAEIYRAKTVDQKLRSVVSARAFASELVAMSIRATHPEWTEDQIHAGVVNRILNGPRFSR